MDKLKNKVLDLIIIAYIIDLKFDLEMYILVVFVTFSFVLHNHLIFRSEYVLLSNLVGACLLDFDLTTASLSNSRPLCHPPLHRL